MTQLGLADAPQEIIDEIIDRCSCEKRTLVACSLTSRTWVYRTRKHLFSKLTLTDKTLPIWCGIVVTPTTTDRGLPRPLSYPPPSSSYASSWLSSHVISLQLVPTYSPDSAHYPNPENHLGAEELLRAKSHLSAFTNLKSLALTAISFAGFDNASLKACFGSLAETVSELKLWVCLLDEDKFFALLRLFVRLESLEVSGNAWLSSGSAGESGTPKNRSLALRGSFTASGFTGGNVGLLESLATAKVQYHTITLGWNPLSSFLTFNALFVKCKDHLKTLTLTAPERSGNPLVLDLSLCGKLVEVQAAFAHAEFGTITPILRMVASPRFRKLTFFVIPPLPMTKTPHWTKLDEEVTALAKRVGATVASDTLQVLFYCYTTAFSGLELSSVEMFLPRVASDPRVSLRVENWSSKH